MRNVGAREGRDFLESLARYLKWRIEQAKDPTRSWGRAPNEHVEKYSIYLKALGAQPKLYKPLMKHMRSMKEAGRVPGF